MAITLTLIWFCLLAVFSSSAAQDETSPNNCSSETFMLHLSDQIKQVAAECGENLPSAWSAQQTAALLVSVRSLADTLHQHQLKDCHNPEPQKCPAPQVPSNGGLVCVTVAKKRYCKAMCNDGYDFAFLRSRVYEECSEQTRHQWTTQYVGGTTLAVCNKENVRIAAAKTAYFPKQQDCLTTKSSILQQNSTIEGFITELINAGVQGEPQHACLLCGRP